MLAKILLTGEGWLPDVTFKSKPNHQVTIVPVDFTEKYFTKSFFLTNVFPLSNFSTFLQVFTVMGIVHKKAFGKARSRLIFSSKGISEETIRFWNHDSWIKFRIQLYILMVLFSYLNFYIIIQNLISLFSYFTFDIYITIYC